MKIELIPLFLDLSQLEYEGLFFDFHNEYTVERLTLAEERVEILFRKIKNEEKVVMVFGGVRIDQLDIAVTALEELSIDMIYRGRKQVDGRLIDKMEGKGYMYLNFVENINIAFWADEMELVESPFGSSAFVLSTFNLSHDCLVYLFIRQNRENIDC